MNLIKRIDSKLMRWTSDYRYRDWSKVPLSRLPPAHVLFSLSFSLLYGTYWIISSFLHLNEGSHLPDYYGVDLLIVVFGVILIIFAFYDWRLWRALKRVKKAHQLTEGEIYHYVWQSAETNKEAKSANATD